jgi:hypothetical protein
MNRSYEYMCMDATSSVILEYREGSPSNEIKEIRVIRVVSRRRRRVYIA